MKRKKINGYQPKELIVADIIAYMGARDRVRIIDLRIPEEMFSGYVCDLKSYPEDDEIQSIIKSEVLSIAMGISISIYVQSDKKASRCIRNKKTIIYGKDR